MALQRPFNINLRAKTIDANEINEITWQVSGDIQVAYKVDILSNIDNSLVWTSNKIVSYSLKHSLPSSVLMNGNEYKIQITIWNSSGANITSYAEIFQTSARPIVTISNTGVISSFNYNFMANYTQNENVPLSNYFVILYNEDKQIIDKSNIKTTLPMEHLFNNLQTDTTYYVEFQATSKKGLIGTSGLVEFLCRYSRPKMNINLQAKNIENAGIEISWDVIQIILKNENGTFIDNEKIDVRNGRIIGDEGFTIDANFTIKMWIEQPKFKEDLILLKGTNGEITLQYHPLDNAFHLYRKINNGSISEWVSNEVLGDSFFVLIQQDNKDMGVSAESIS